MLTSFYTAATGAIAQQNGIAVTANNIANVSTNGYKSDENAFSDLLYSNIRGNEQNSDLKVGHGTKLGTTDTVFTQGTISKTGRNLDYALTDSDTFFAVKTPSGIKYTRDGAFRKAVGQDGKYYLADENGGYVLDASGQPVVVENEEAKQNIGVYTFNNLDGLLKAGSNYFSATNASGNALSVKNAGVRQRYLESSSTDLANEMNNVITSERTFELNAKVVQISDEIMETVNNLR